jgi:hypothetical protein
MYIDAVCIMGESRGFSVSINKTKDDSEEFEPLNLEPYAVEFRILGSPTSDSKVLVEHIITQNTDLETEGTITDAANGEFTFVVSKEDTRVVGLGEHPISIRLLDPDLNVPVYTLTEGVLMGEFSKIQVVQV